MSVEEKALIQARRQKGNVLNNKNVDCFIAGMLDSLMCKMMNRGIIKNGIETDKMLMIGDASGKDGQFSDSDKKTAENFGIDYMDVDDFVNTNLED